MKRSIPSQQPGIRPAKRRGVTLLEVLICMFVLTVGILGLAALIPVGGFAIIESGKADRSGACGRAALREVKVRRMLDWRLWYPIPGTIAGNPFIIDPLSKSLDGSHIKARNGQTIIRRLSLKPTMHDNRLLTLDEAEAIFMWHDELVFDRELNGEGRPLQVVSVGPTGPVVPKVDPQTGAVTQGLPEALGNFTWFLTVEPAAREAMFAMQKDRDNRSTYSVSVVVCFKRTYGPYDYNTNPKGEIVANVSFLTPVVAHGGGHITLDQVVKIRENQWIMLTDGVQCKWYRVMSSGTDTDFGPGTALSLTGPDWYQSQRPTMAVIFDSVVGVYTTTMELDGNPRWAAR